MVAFLVVSHRNPGQVLRLVRALREGDDTAVLVHHDQRREPLDRDALEDAGGRLAHYGLSVEWGNVAYTEMLLRALSQLTEELDPDWVAVVSGQDYPLRPLSDFERHLARSPHHALLGDAWELDLSAEPPPPRREFYLRYRFRHYAPPRTVAAAWEERALGWSRTPRRRSNRIAAGCRASPASRATAAAVNTRSFGGRRVGIGSLEVRAVRG